MADPAADPVDTAARAATAFDAVVFDFFGTLTPATPDETWRDYAARTAAPLGIPASAWFQALGDSTPERFTGALGGAEQTYATLAERCGVRPAPEALAEAVAIRRATQHTLFRTRPETLPLLAALRGRGLRLAVVSDCTVELAEAWPSLPVAAAVDVAVFSCVVGVRKPDPELFRRAADGLGVAPARCLYVGDGGGRELFGSSALGMTAVHLDVDEPGAAGRQRGWDGPRITALPEVERLLTAGLSPAV